MRVIAITTLFILATSLPVVAKFVFKTDNEISAHDLLTGKLIWTHKPEKLMNARFEMYKHGLVAYPNYAGDKKWNPIFLNPEDGSLIRPFKTAPPACLARSAVFWPPPKIKLANGWVLQEFSAGNTKTLKFADPKTRKITWSIQTSGYPRVLGCWRDYVFYAFSHSSDEGVLYAYQAGKDKPSWTVDLNKILKGRKEPITRMKFQVIGDVIYLNAAEHIFAFDPRTGRLQWHRNLAKDLKLPFAGGFYGGQSGLAVFAKSGNILIVSFDKRVVAIDLKSMQYLWHLEPDTFPAHPFPVAHNGKVFLSSGKNRRLFKMGKGKAAANNTIDSGKN